jgi:hypothetical protein
MELKSTELLIKYKSLKFIFIKIVKCFSIHNSKNVTFAHISDLTRRNSFAFDKGHSGHQSCTFLTFHLKI